MWSSNYASINKQIKKKKIQHSTEKKLPESKIFILQPRCNRNLIILLQFLKYNYFFR